MNRTFISILLVSLSSINLVISTLVINRTEKTSAVIIAERKRIEKQEETIYSPSSLDRALNLLKKSQDKLSGGILPVKTGILELTETILIFYRKNNLEMVTYRINGIGEDKEIYLKAKGTTLDIIKCIFDLSFSTVTVRITYLTINTASPGKKAEIILRAADA